MRWPDDCWENFSWETISQEQIYKKGGGWGGHVGHMGVMPSTLATVNTVQVHSGRYDTETFIIGCERATSKKISFLGGKMVFGKVVNLSPFGTFSLALDFHLFCSLPYYEYMSCQYNLFTNFATTTFTCFAIGGYYLTHSHVRDGGV